MNLFSLLKKAALLLLPAIPIVFGSRASSTGAAAICTLPPIESLPCYFPSDAQRDAPFTLKNSFNEILYADHFNPNRVAQWGIDKVGFHPQLTEENECSLMMCSKEIFVNEGYAIREMCNSYSLYKKRYIAAKEKDSHTKPGWRTTFFDIYTPKKERLELMKELCPPCPPRSNEAARTRPRNCHPGHL